MKRETWEIVKWFLVELALYAALVTVYFFLVLHSLGGVLLNLFQEERKLYAFAALALIIGQGIVLEILTRAVLRVFRRKGERK